MLASGGSIITQIQSGVLRPVAVIGCEWRKEIPNTPTVIQAAKSLGGSSTATGEITTIADLMRLDRAIGARAGRGEKVLAVPQAEGVSLRPPPPPVLRLAPDRSARRGRGATVLSFQRKNPI